MEEYIQPRILKALVSKGGKATSREISKITGMKMTVVSRGGAHLKFYGVVKRETIVFIENNMPRKIHVYTLIKGRAETVRRMLNKIPEGWVKE